MTIDERNYPAKMGDFVYKITTSTGKSTQTRTYRFSYLILHLPFGNVPDLLIRREGMFDKLAGAFGFDDIDFESAVAEARRWVLEFVHWYNCTHKHSGLKFISPNQRHEGVEKEIMAQRETVYATAKAKHPERWSGNTRNWELPTTVYLNPEKEQAEREVMALAKTG